VSEWLCVSTSSSYSKSLLRESYSLILSQICLAVLRGSIRVTVWNTTIGICLVTCAAFCAYWLSIRLAWPVNMSVRLARVFYCLLSREFATLCISTAYNRYSLRGLRTLADDLFGRTVRQRFFNPDVRFFSSPLHISYPVPCHRPLHIPSFCAISAT
jgi:hypothetical protein